MTESTPGQGPQNSDAAQPPPPTRLPRGVLAVSVGVVWLAAVVFGVLIATLSRPAAFASWLSLALGVCVLLAFFAQLATRQKDGFVNRLAATLTGCLVILALAGGVLAVIARSH